MNTTVKRTIFGVIFLAVMLGGLLFDKIAFCALFLFIDCVMAGEFLRITMGKEHKGVQYAAIGVAALAFIIAGLVVWVGIPESWLSLNLVTVMALMMLMIHHHSNFKDYSYVFTALVYIALPLSFSHYAVRGPEGFDGSLLLNFFILIWSSDTGAYCFGMLFGQKIWPARLCPEISPKKSWAGFWGGLVTTLLAAWILRLVGLWDFPIVHCLILATIMNVTGVFGDLFESLWKRQFGVKDSGHIIPGHGGLLDRFDSSLFAMPAGYVYLLLNGLL